jgi:hypothetical protein
LIWFFDFSTTHLQDDGAILFFYVDKSKLKTILKGFLMAYHFKVHKEWMDVNQLKMSNAREVDKRLRD